MKKMASCSLTCTAFLTLRNWACAKNLHQSACARKRGSRSMKMLNVEVLFGSYQNRYEQEWDHQRDALILDILRMKPERPNWDGWNTLRGEIDAEVWEQRAGLRTEQERTWSRSVWEERMQRMRRDGGRWLTATPLKGNSPKGNEKVY